MGTDNAEVKEVVSEQKDLSKLNDEELAKLSDSDLAALSLQEKTDTAPEEPKADEEAKEEPKVEEEEKKEEEKEEEKHEADLTQEEVDKLPKDAKGLYFNLKKEREQRQELEKRLRDIELNNARLQATHETTMKFVKPDQQGKQFATEYERIVSGITEEAKKYEAEYGEKYRLTSDDFLAIEKAKKQDELVFAQRATIDRESAVFQDRCSQSEKQLKSELKSSGEDDYDHVYKSFIVPMLTPTGNKDTDRRAAHLVMAMAQSDDPAKFAYDVIAQMSQQGREYFSKKHLKAVNKTILKEEKQIPKTSAHLDSTKSSGGKIKITLEDAMKDDALMMRLTDAEISALSEGKELLK